MLSELRAELARLSVDDVEVSLDSEFEPRAGTFVKIELGEAYWHLLPEQFLQLLNDLPDGARSEAVRVAIEKHGTFVWHGPAPTVPATPNEERCIHLDVFTHRSLSKPTRRSAVAGRFGRCRSASG